MANHKKKKPGNNRTTYHADLNELFKYAALMNSGGLIRNMQTNATEMLKRCVFAQKGVEKRPIDNDEITRFIAKGYELTE